MDYDRDEYFLHFTGTNVEKLSLNFPVPIYLSAEGSKRKKTQWEMAPLETALTVDWENFNSDEDFFTFTLEGADFSRTVAVPNGHYNTYRSLVTALNEEKNKFAALKGHVNFLSPATFNGLQLKVTRPDWRVRLSPKLAKRFKVEILPGEADPPIYEVQDGADHMLLPWSLDFYEDHRMVHILCDQAPYQLVNNSAHPILASFPIGGSYEHKEWIQHTFYQNRYQTLDCGSILNGLTISLTDEKMKPLRGVFDHAYCLVHLRRKKSV